MGNIHTNFKRGVTLEKEKEGRYVRGLELELHFRS